MIEEQFFKAFEIGGVMLATNPSQYKYPEITAERLLDLICILINKESPITFVAGYKPTKIKNLKNLVLEGCIKYSEELKEQVRKVFEGE